MPLPLYGSGGRTLRISAAVWPTICLSMPLTTIWVGVGTSNEMPARGATTTGCEKPTVSSVAWTRPGDSATITPEGKTIGCFPIRDISSPDETDDLAADALLLGAAARHQSARG